MATRQSRAIASWRRQAVRRIGAARRAMQVFVARLPERDVLRPRTQDRWSVKDVLAHLLGSDEETVRRFRLIARGRGDRIHWFESMADADRFNAAAVSRARRLGLPALRRRRERVAADLVRWLERLPAGALRDPSHRYTVVEWLPAPGWTHERDHLSELRAWWRGRPARGRAAGHPSGRGGHHEDEMESPGGPLLQGATDGDPEAPWTQARQSLRRQSPTAGPRPRRRELRGADRNLSVLRQRGCGRDQGRGAV